MVNIFKKRTTIYKIKVSVMMEKLLQDRIFRLPRIWSNDELLKFAYLFKDDVVNVSGWKDFDKNGKHYKDYFINSKNYFMTNANMDSGLQGDFENEIELDLSKEIPENLYQKFDVCFNHTVLEHIFEIDQSFKNICDMSKDIVILVTPFSQPVHYAKDKSWLDYWRLTPFAIEKYFKKNGFEMLYMNCNENLGAGSYIFSIATRNKLNWLEKHEDFGKIKYSCNCGIKIRWFKLLFNLLKK